MAAVPWRSADAEKALAGKPLDAATISGGGSGGGESAMAVGENGYKIALARGVLEETLTGLANA